MPCLVPEKPLIMPNHVLPVIGLIGNIKLETDDLKPVKFCKWNEHKNKNKL